MSNRRVRSAGQYQVVVPLSRTSGGGSSRSLLFRPLFPASKPEQGVPSAPVENQEEEDEVQRYNQRMAEEWVAKLAEVDQVLRQARQQAETLAQQAEAEGYQTGYAKGYAEGMEIGRHALDQEVANVQAIAQAAAQARQELLASLEGEVVALALAIAKKIIGEEAARNGDVIAYTVQKAIRQLGQRSSYRIRLNPQDAQHLMERWKTTEALGGAEWELVPDERISPGGCILESGAGSVDARLDIQFDLIQKAFLEAQEAVAIQELPGGSEG